VTPCFSPSGAVAVDYGGSQTFNIAATTAGYHIANVVVDGVPQGPIATYTFSNVGQVVPIPSPTIK